MFSKWVKLIILKVIWNKKGFLSNCPVQHLCQNMHWWLNNKQLSNPTPNFALRKYLYHLHCEMTMFFSKHCFINRSDISAIFVVYFYYFPHFIIVIPCHRLLLLLLFCHCSVLDMLDITSAAHWLTIWWTQYLATFYITILYYGEGVLAYFSLKCVIVSLVLC